MANNAIDLGIKIPDLNELLTAAGDDILVIVDASTDETKFITKQNFAEDIGIRLDDIVVQNSITPLGSGSLAYNTISGVITYTPPEIPTDVSELTDTTGLLDVDVSEISNLSTDTVPEGSNLYFTTERGRSLFSGGQGLNYNSANGTFDTVQDISTTGSVEFANLTISQDVEVTGNVSASGIFVGQITDISNHDTDDVAEGSTNLYYTTGRWDTRLATKTTDNLDEGATNLYYRVNMDAEFSDVIINGNVDVDGVISGNVDGFVSSISNHTTDGLPEGSTNLYYTDGRVQVLLDQLTTDDVPETSSNRYYTDSRVQDEIGRASINDLADVFYDVTKIKANESIIWNSQNSRFETGVTDTIPLGTFNWFTLSTVPAGWIVADGSAITDVFPALRQLYVDAGYPYGQDLAGNPKLPDLRGYFVRGWDDGRGVDANRGFGTTQNSNIGAHEHSAGTLATNTTGEHSHTLYGNDRGNNAGQKSAPGLFVDDAERAAEDSGTIRSGGAHSHTITGQTGTAGSGETRPSNIALLPCVKAYGSVNLVGVAEIQNLLDSIASEAEALAGTDNGKVMTPLRVKQAIDQALGNTTVYWAGATNLNNVKTTYVNFPNGTKVAFFEERVYYRPSNSNGGSVQINDRYRRVVQKVTDSNWVDVGG